MDFWGTFCGPCTGMIKTMSKWRELNRENPDFKFIFITGMAESPDNQYNDFVANELLGEESHRLSNEDFGVVKDHFNISGFPRYMLVGREGEIVNDDYEPIVLNQDLEELGVTFYQ